MSSATSAPELPNRLKRRREEPESSHAPVNNIKHGLLYYDNGDIVLLSLPKDGVITAFKVDKVFLSRHSPVFQGMLSMPSPEIVDKYDGVPLVHVQDEEVHLSTFLRALYDATSLPFQKHSYHTASDIEGVLKLSIKYEVETLRNRTVEILSADWPNALSSWDTNEQEIASIKNKFSFTAEHEYSPFDDVLPEPCSVIRLARDCDIPQILPAAFYHLSRIPPFADRNETRIPPGSQKYWDYVWETGRRADFGLLSQHDLMCLLKGHHAMTEFLQDHIIDTAESVPKGCVSKQKAGCRKALETFMAAYEKYFPIGCDALDILQEHVHIPTELCVMCRHSLLVKLRQTRVALWEKLPIFFDLETATQSDVM